MCNWLWGAKHISVGSLCGEIAAVRRREEEEKQRKKAKLAAKLRKLMEAEAKAERKRLSHKLKPLSQLNYTSTGKSHLTENTRKNEKGTGRKRKNTEHMKLNQAHLRQIRNNKTGIHFLNSVTPLCGIINIYYNI